MFGFFISLLPLVFANLRIAKFTLTPDHIGHLKDFINEDFPDVSEALPKLTAPQAFYSDDAQTPYPSAIGSYFHKTNELQIDQVPNGDQYSSMSFSM